jgi:hypothetical protein
VKTVRKLWKKRYSARSTAPWWTTFVETVATIEMDSSKRIPPVRAWHESLRAGGDFDLAACGQQITVESCDEFGVMRCVGCGFPIMSPPVRGQWRKYHSVDCMRLGATVTAGKKPKRRFSSGRRAILRRPPSSRSVRQLSPYEIYILRILAENDGLIRLEDLDAKMNEELGYRRPSKVAMMFFRELRLVDWVRDRKRVGWVITELGCQWVSEARRRYGSEWRH